MSLFTLYMYHVYALSQAMKMRRELMCIFFLLPRVVRKGTKIYFCLQSHDIFETKQTFFSDKNKIIFRTVKSSLYRHEDTFFVSRGKKCCLWLETFDILQYFYYKLSCDQCLSRKILKLNLWYTKEKYVRSSASFVIFFFRTN